MCFSAEADFVTGAAIGLVGVATLTKVRHPREIPLASLPLALAVHQIIEGFVWLDLDGGAPRSTGAAVTIYLLFAWAALPVLAPLSIMLLEPPGPARRRSAVFVVLGAIAGAYLLVAVLSGDVFAHSVEHTIQYGARAASPTPPRSCTWSRPAARRCSRASGPSCGSASRTWSRWRAS